MNKKILGKHLIEIRQIVNELRTDTNATFKSYNRCLNRLEELRKEYNIDQVEWTILLIKS